MKREQITSIVYVNGNEKPQSLKFTDRVIEVKHYKQLNGKLNEVRSIATKILGAINESEVKIYLNTKEWK